MSVSLTNPIAINSYNVSSLRFNIDTLVDFTLDPLRRKDWRIFYTQQTDKLRANYRRQAKKYAYYYSLLVDSNPSLCFQDVIIQKSPLVNSTSHDHRTNAASYSNRQPRYGEDYIILGVPVQVVCEINQQLGKHYTIPIGTCQTIITGDHYWITVSPPPAYPPQLVDENLDTFRLQWDDFVRGELSDSSWKAHIIGQARVQTESKIRLVAATKTTNEQDDNDDFRRSRAQLNHTDFSLNLIIYKVILINRIEIDSPSQSEFVEQLDVCFVKGHDHQTKTINYAQIIFRKMISGTTKRWDEAKRRSHSITQSLKRRLTGVSTV